MGACSTCPTSRLYSTLKVDMPGAEDLKSDSRMDAALGWCCCLAAIDGEREPVPWNNVFYRKRGTKVVCIKQLIRRANLHSVGAV